MEKKKAKYFRKFLVFFATLVSIANIVAVGLFWNWLKKIEIQGGAAIRFFPLLSCPSKSKFDSSSLFSHL
jgi:hypothetical protein